MITIITKKKQLTCLEQKQFFFFFCDIYFRFKIYDWLAYKYLDVVGNNIQIISSI